MYAELLNFQPLAMPADLLARYGSLMMPDIHWIFAVLSVTVVTFGSYSIYLAVFTYFADV